MASIVIRLSAAVGSAPAEAQAAPWCERAQERELPEVANVASVAVLHRLSLLG
jgi:hypothetical protein